MIFIAGRADYGRVDNDDGSVDETHFVHLFALPVLPLFTTRTEATGESRRIGLRPLSVALGYLRVLALPLGLVLAKIGIGQLVMRELVLGWLSIVVAGGLIVGAAASWTWLGKRTRRTASIVLAHVLTGIPLFLFLALSGILTAASLHADRKAVASSSP